MFYNNVVFLFDLGREKLGKNDGRDFVCLLRCWEGLIETTAFIILNVCVNLIESLSQIEELEKGAMDKKEKEAKEEGDASEKVDEESASKDQVRQVSPCT